MIQNPFVTCSWILALHLAAWSVGRRLHAWLGRRETLPEPAPQAFLLCQLLGFLLLGQVAFFLAAAGLLHAELLLAAGAALAIESLVHLWRRRKRFHLRLTAADIPALAAVLFMAQFVPEAMHPVLIQDDQVYHLFLPRLYLERHHLVSLPWHVNANMPHLTEVLYTWAAAVGDFTAPKLLALSFTALTMHGLWGYAASRCGRVGAGITLLLFVSGKNVQWHAGIGHIEPVLGAYLLGAVLALAAWQARAHRDSESAPSRPPWLLVGLLCAFATVSKYTAWLFVLPVLVLLCGLAWRRTGAGALGGMLRLTSALAALQIPWLVKSTLQVGNPVYPNLAAWFGTERWSATQELHYRLAMRTLAGAGDPGGWTWYLAIPFRLTVLDHYYECASFSIVFMALFLCALVLAVRKVGGDPEGARDRMLVALAWSGFVLWAATLPQGRYLTAWVPVMVVATTPVLAALGKKRRFLAGALVLVVGLGLYQLLFQRWPFKPRWGTLVHGRLEAVRENTAYDLAQYLNSAVPRSGKVLGLWENRFFFLERDFAADSVWQVPYGLARLRQLDDPERFAATLVQEGFSHVVVQVPEMNRYFANAYPFDLLHPVLYPQARFEADRRLMEGFVQSLNPVLRSGPCVVFELPAPGQRMK